MSRVGQVPISLPSGVKVEVGDNDVKVIGAKGELIVRLLKGVSVKAANDTVVLRATAASPRARARHGLLRTLIANAVAGVSEGFKQTLEINGVGYRAQVSGAKMILHLGFSAPIEYQLPDGVSAQVEDNVITVAGIDKQLVGQVAAHIRSFRKPEPYKGKGIKYQDERIRRKAGKTAAAGPTGAGA